MNNEYLKRLERRKIGDAGRKSEKNTTKRFSGKATAASGAKTHSKGDFTVGDSIPFRAEAKSTSNATISIEAAWLQKISREALDSNSNPMVTITFTRLDGKAVHGGKWVLLPEEVAKDLIDLANKVKL